MSSATEPHFVTNLTGRDVAIYDNEKQLVTKAIPSDGLAVAHIHTRPRGESSKPFAAKIARRGMGESAQWLTPGRMISLVEDVALVIHGGFFVPDWAKNPGPRDLYMSGMPQTAPFPAVIVDAFVGMLILKHPEMYPGIVVTPDTSVDSAVATDPKVWGVTRLVVIKLDDAS